MVMLSSSAGSAKAQAQRVVGRFVHLDAQQSVPVDRCMAASAPSTNSKTVLEALGTKSQQVTSLRHGQGAAALDAQISRRKHL